MPGDGCGLVGRCAVRQSPPRCVDAACGGGRAGPGGGPGWMGSFALRNPLVFAYEWASLDVLSNGRTRLVVCAGGGAGPLWEAESAALNIAPGERRKRMIENIHVLRHLWTKDNQPF